MSSLLARDRRVCSPRAVRQNWCEDGACYPPRVLCTAAESRDQFQCAWLNAARRSLEKLANSAGMALPR